MSVQSDRQAIIDRVDAEWQSLGVDEIDIAVLEAAPARQCPKCGTSNRDEARFCDQCGEDIKAAPTRDHVLRVHLQAHVQTGLDPHMPKEHVMAIHRALLRGQHTNQDLVALTPAHQYPLGAAMLANGVAHPHSPSVQHGAGKHGKVVYFTTDQSPDDVIAMLRRGAALLPDMLTQTQKHEEHVPVDHHPRIGIQHTHNPNWQEVYRRPA